MKKVFVSIPLKGRSKEEIQSSLDKIKGAVEGLLDGEVELLHQDVKDLPEFEGESGSEENLEFLGKDLELMAKADYFATVENNWDFRHCRLEEDIFEKYKNPGKPWEDKKENMFRFSLNIIAPDLVKKEKEEAEKLFGMEFGEREMPVEEKKEVLEIRETKD